MFFALVVIVMLGIIILHVRHAIATKAIVSWAAELLIVMIILVVPNINDSAFHIHHWFFCLIVAMFARYTFYKYFTNVSCAAPPPTARNSAVVINSAAVSSLNRALTEP